MEQFLKKHLFSRWLYDNKIKNLHGDLFLSRWLYDNKIKNLHGDLFTLLVKLRYL